MTVGARIVARSIVRASGKLAGIYSRQPVDSKVGASAVDVALSGAIRHSGKRRAAASVVGAAVIYGYISFWYFGQPVWGHLASRYVGVGTDPTNISMWALAWWPWALGHLTNPIFSTYLWAPTGVNLAWVTSIPLPSLLLLPVTAWAGPEFS